MFYTMKLGILFVVASLTLVGAIVVIAIPNPIEAAPKHQWCSAVAPCTDNRGECKKLNPGAPCIKTPVF